VAEWAVKLQPFEISFETTKVIKSKALAEFTAEWTDPFADEPPEVESTLPGEEAPVSGSCTSTVPSTFPARGLGRPHLSLWVQALLRRLALFQARAQGLQQHREI
jgi:hypothetical protein